MTLGNPCRQELDHIRVTVFDMLDDVRIGKRVHHIEPLYREHAQFVGALNQRRLHAYDAVRLRILLNKVHTDLF